MKQFDLELAKAGDPVVTREWVPITLIHFNVPGKYPIVGYNHAGEIYRFTLKGRYYSDVTPSISQHDLFMAPKKVQYWANLYRIVSTGAINVGHIWISEAIAIENIIDSNEDKTYIKTILLHEEEI